MIPFVLGIAFGLGIIIYVSHQPPQPLSKSSLDQAISEQLKKSQKESETTTKRAEEKFREELKKLEEGNEEASERERIERAISKLEKQDQQAIISSLKQEKIEKRKLTRKEMQEASHRYRAKEFGKTVLFTFLELVVVSCAFIFIAHQFVGVGTLESKLARWLSGM